MEDYGMQLLLNRVLDTELRDQSQLLKNDIHAFNAESFGSMNKNADGYPKKGIHLPEVCLDCLSSDHHAKHRASPHDDFKPIQTTTPTVLIMKLAFKAFGFSPSSKMSTYPYLYAGFFASAIRDKTLSL